MAGAIYSDHFKNHGLAWTLVLSVALHAALLSAMPPFRFNAPAKVPPMMVELQQPEPEPPPVETVQPPQPQKPEPPKQEPKPEPKPAPHPTPRKPVEESAPAKTLEPAPAEAPREETPPSPPPVITAAPKVEEQPAFTAPPPPPEPPKPVGPTDVDIENARKAYGNSWSREIAKYKRYPRIAQMRGWEGSVRLLLQIDGDGKIVSVTLAEASDREAFNTEALEMVKRIVQPPPIPETLRGRSFSVIVPVVFKLQ